MIHPNESCFHSLEPHLLAYAIVTCLWLGIPGIITFNLT